ncbi:uncharacterized protein LOC128739680 [Sabethes cyaneus]|uniref:uncharacterized protein LOC128739680 n=1 Tax=Sabethes cyaneus TaxID=53552 RepID=UPI00237DD1FD|nr:uncharacterized protein LOC128739680 [Sabethes cyaneus]
MMGKEIVAVSNDKPLDILCSEPVPVLSSSEATNSSTSTVLASQSLQMSDHSEQFNKESSVVTDPSTDTVSLRLSEEQSASINSGRQSIPRRKSSAPKKTPNSKVIVEIAKLQSCTSLVIPKLTFARVIREVLMDYVGKGFRITADALLCFQESAEIFTVQLMEDAYRCTIHRDRNTLMPKDMQLAMLFRFRKGD